MVLCAPAFVAKLRKKKGLSVDHILIHLKRNENINIKFNIVLSLPLACWCDKVTFPGNIDEVLKCGSWKEIAQLSRQLWQPSLISEMV